MKRLLTLLMLLPALCHAQLVEFSVKGGAITNRMMQRYLDMSVKNPIGYAGSFAATVGFPGAVRLGFAVSAYEVKAERTYPVYDGSGKLRMNETEYIRYGNPMIPVEVLLIKRFNPGRIRLDIGGSIGTLMNMALRVHYRKDVTASYEIHAKAFKWRTYGALLGLQYRLGLRSGIGFEVQPKWITMRGYDTSFAMPVMAKYCFYII